MPLFRIAVGLIVLGVCAAVLSFVFNVLKALLVVSAVAFALGIVVGVRGLRRRRTAIAAPAGSSLRRRDK